MQFHEGERLRQIVVRPRVEPRYAVLDRVAGGQHQHRRPDVGVAERSARDEAVDAGQHHVEHDRFVGMRTRHPESVLSLRRHVGGVAVFAQAAVQEAGELGVILDDEDTHAPTVPAGI